MNKMKYIIVDNGMYDTPIIFNEATNHSVMAAAVPGKVVSAGFVVFRPTGLECYGRSVSLNINSAGEVDSKLINKMLGVGDE